MSNSRLSILTLNGQSINVKFDDFQIAIDIIYSNYTIGVICIC